MGKDGNNVALQDSVPCFYRYVLVFDYFLREYLVLNISLNKAHILFLSTPHGG